VDGTGNIGKLNYAYKFFYRKLIRDPLEDAGGRNVPV
jgi:hypothetical protein